MKIATRYSVALKIGSLDYTVQEFSLAKLSWYTSNYTMLYKYGKRKSNFVASFYIYFSLGSIFWGVTKK